jgi:hypothetical protein
MFYHKSRSKTRNYREIRGKRHFRPNPAFEKYHQNNNKNLPTSSCFPILVLLSSETVAFQNVHAGVGGGIRTQISSASDTLPTV